MRPISPKAAKPSRDRHATRRRRDRERHGEIGARLLDAHSAGDVDEHVGARERHARVAAEDGDDHREPLRVDTGPDPSRHREIGRSDERLDLEQDRPCALERTRHGRPDLARARRAEELRRVGHADETGGRHLEDAELVRRAEPILRRPQDAVLVVAVAFELQDAVDEVLEDARAGDRAVLRDVADEHRGHRRLLRDAEQPACRLAHLRDRAGSRAERRRRAMSERSR